MASPTDPNFAYPHAPITEAVLDIRSIARDGFDVSSIGSMAEGLKSEYPEVQKAFHATGQLSVDPGSESSTSRIIHNEIGVRARSSDGGRVYQAQLNGLSVSKLPPYKDWADLKAEAKKIWSAYSAIATPRQRTRIALRYINRIDIPGGGGPVDLDAYFRTRIEVSPDLGTTIENFFLQLQLPQDDIGCSCSINSTALPPASPGVISILLDIDLFRNEGVPQEDEDMWNLFDTLRVRKNKIFEACITDQTRDLFL